jgi:iron transport multicopper oxidase
MNVVDMAIQQPIVVPLTRPDNPMLLRISAFADLQKGTVEVGYSLHSVEPSRRAQNAGCSILYGDADIWLGKWSRTAYLVQKRVKDLENGLLSGTTNKILRRMAYQLFSNLVQYDHKFQGMHEVLLDHEELESVAALKLYAEKGAGSFFCSPFWIDSFVHLAGFIMNAIDVIDSHNAVYISHGWGAMRFAETIDPRKPYRVHVKMQPLGKTMFAGDATIFQDQKMVGLVEDLKFQQVPRSLLNTLLPAPSLSRTLPRVQALVKVPEFTAVPNIRKTPPTPTVNHNPRAFAQANLTSHVLDIIAEEIGISPNELSSDGDLSEFGVDSLLSLTILSRLREALHMDLPTNLFQEYPTIGSLRQYFQMLKASESGSEASSIVATPISTNNAAVGHIMKPQGEAALIRSVLRSTIAEQIGIEVEELLAAEDLSSLGVDSLLSLSILGALRDRLEINIPPSAIIGGSSMSVLEKTLNLSPEALLESESPVIPASSKNKPVPKNSPGMSFILQGNPKTSSKSIFIFPDGSGSATSYAKLPEISPNVCIIGLNSPYLNAGRDISFSIEDITESWLAELRSRQPRGPYILAGWSAGGYYAFEATKRLLQEGEEVEKLILIDSPSRNIYGSMPPEVLDFVSQNGIMGSGGVVPRWLMDHFDITLKAVTRYAVSPIDQLPLPKVYIIWACEGAMESSTAVDTALDLGIPVSQFLLKRKPNFGPLGWERLLNGADIVIAKTLGNHFSMVQPPNVCLRHLFYPSPCSLTYSAQAQSLSRLIAEAIGTGPLQRFKLWEQEG